MTQRRSDPEQTPTQRAHEKALRLLELRPRSTAELSRRLHQAGFEPETVEPLLARLTNVGLLNDREFAEMLIRSRREFSGHGVRRIEQELRQHRLDSELIAELLHPVVAPDMGERESAPSETERAREQALRRLRQLRKHPREVQRRRLVGFLSRRGFEASVVYLVVDEVMGAEQEESVSAAEFGNC